MKKLHKTVLATTIGLSCFGVYADSIKPESKVVQPDGSPIGFKYKIGTQSPYSKELRNIRLPVYPGSKIVVLPGFVNESDKSLTNGDVQLDATGNVELTQTSVMVADVAPKSEGKAAEVLKLKIPEDYVCGLPGEVEPIKIDLTASGLIDGKKHVIEEEITRYIGFPDPIQLGITNDGWMGTKMITDDFGVLSKQKLFEPEITANLRVGWVEAADGSKSRPKSIKGLKVTLRTPTGENIVLLDRLEDDIPLSAGKLSMAFPMNEQQRKVFASKLNHLEFGEGFQIIWETKQEKMYGVASSRIDTVSSYICPAKPIIHDAINPLKVVENEELSFTPKVYNNTLSEGETTYQWSLVQANGLVINFKNDEKELSFTAPDVSKDTMVKFKVVAENNFGMKTEKTFNVEITNKAKPTTGTDTTTPGTTEPDTTPDSTEPEVSTPPKTETKPKAKSSGGDGGGAIFYLIAGLFGLLQMRRRS
ncbi:hypothetical protein [Algicola sagamiensis]|uniref:hypothetical protein n=1 Tax=Algicola sagamiensis TaxID=163869 RepID=UPI00035CE4A6|nr:hypothetical protein [Algicola sagamiensis]